jgi:cysteinyl-tRNA synthetase
VAHMRNDFNTSGALGVLSKPLGEVNGLLDSGKGVSKAVRYLTIERFVGDMEQVAAVLGCFGQDPDTWLMNRRDGKAARMGLDIAMVEDLLVQRTTARQDKDWGAADRIREELTDLGVGVQDGPEGSVWSFI